MLLSGRRSDPGDPGLEQIEQIEGEVANAMPLKISLREPIPQVSDHTRALFLQVCMCAACIYTYKRGVSRVSQSPLMFSELGQGFMLGPDNHGQMTTGVAWRLDKIGTRVAFERSIVALKKTLLSLAPIPAVQVAKQGANADLVSLIHSPSELIARTNVWGAFGGAEIEAGAVQRGCNPSQARAVAHAVRRRLTLVHGPPGTGKTRTAVEIVRTWVREGRTPVLVCADSNIAVDNLCLGCIQHMHPQHSVVRVGGENKVRPELQMFTIDMANPVWEHPSATVLHMGSSTTQHSATPLRTEAVPTNHRRKSYCAAIDCPSCRRLHRTRSVG